MKQDLQQAGFKDVQVFHAAHVISAMTPGDGRVAMTISPNGFMCGGRGTRR